MSSLYRLALSPDSWVNPPSEPRPAKIKPSLFTKIMIVIFIAVLMAIGIHRIGQAGYVWTLFEWVNQHAALIAGGVVLLLGTRKFATKQKERAALLSLWLLFAIDDLFLPWWHDLRPFGDSAFTFGMHTILIMPMGLAIRSRHTQPPPYLALDEDGHLYFTNGQHTAWAAPVKHIRHIEIRRNLTPPHLADIHFSKVCFVCGNDEYGFAIPDDWPTSQLEALMQHIQRLNPDFSTQLLDPQSRI